MGTLKRGGLAVEHPGQLAEATRGLDGRPDSETPYVAGQRYLPMADGTPAESIPEPPITGSDFDVVPLNTPEGLAGMRLREMPPPRESKKPVVAAPEPEEDDDEDDVPLIGNFVNFDDSVAHLDGQLVPLNDIEIQRIQGIVVRALQRKLTEELKRVKSAYTMQPKKRKVAMSKRRRTRKETLPEAPRPEEQKQTEAA